MAKISQNMLFGTFLSLILLVVIGCMHDPKPKSDGTESTTTTASEPSIQEVQEILKEAAKRRREAYQSLTFEEFEKKVFKEPFPGGKYIVNGDTPVPDKKRLKEFFGTQIKGSSDSVSTGMMAKLVVNQVGGQDTVWNSTQKAHLTYCVSTAFGTRYDQVVQDMEAAGKAWEQVADLNFFHVVSEDGSCDESNQNVLFDVRPVNVNGEYLARAFFPHEPRVGRNVLIDESSFSLDPNGKLTLVGILRHELGHTLGFRHEHTRPDSGTCFEDNDWRPLTDYDAFSVMHYPQCNGQGDWSLTLTHEDKNGAACLYDPAPGFSVDPGICPTGTVPDPSPCPSGSESFPQQAVAAGEEKHYGPFSVASGSVFEAKMEGAGTAGDPDLYVRFGQAPTQTQYICRPFLTGADETCSVDVPSGQNQAFVMVRGYAAGNYNLTVTHTPAH